jgi:hypothetical protein
MGTSKSRRHPQRQVDHLDDAEARKFVGVDGEIERGMLLWFVDYCGGLLG